jgi:hypothetical protein
MRVLDFYVQNLFSFRGETRSRYAFLYSAPRLQSTFVAQGCLAVFFSYQKCKFWYTLEGLGMANFGVFHGQVFLLPFWYFYSRFGIFNSHFSIMHSRFGILYSSFGILYSRFGILYSRFGICFPNSFFPLKNPATLMQQTGNM